MARIASSFTGSVAPLRRPRSRRIYPLSRFPAVPIVERIGTFLTSHALLARIAFAVSIFRRGPCSVFERLRSKISRGANPRKSLDDDEPEEPRLIGASLFLSSHQAKSVSKVIKADIYPEFGTYPGGGESPIIPFGSEKNAEREVIHGRWAMLGVTGAWAAENGTGIPWFTAGTLCTPDDCTAVADKFPGAVAPLAPEGSGYPSFWAVLAIEVVLVGLAEAYRTGLSDPVFDELTVGDVSPGGRFDPLGLAESGDLEELKIKELKHCRLSMFAWLGCIMQGLATQEGPIANWQAHVADPVHANVLTNAASGFGFY